jgi:hypothetical protein
LASSIEEGAVTKPIPIPKIPIPIRIRAPIFNLLENVYIV